jgi:hypothetical protein
MWAIIDDGLAVAQLATTPSAVTAAASSAHGSITVLAIHEITEKALDAYKQATPTSDDEADSPVHDLELRRKKTGSA